MERRGSGLRALGGGEMQGLAEAVAVKFARAERQGSALGRQGKLKRARKVGGGGRLFNGAWAVEGSQGPKFRYYSKIEALHQPANK